MTRVAAIVTVYQEWAHGDALGTKFFAGTSTDEGFFPPEVEVSPHPPPSQTDSGHDGTRSNRPRRVQVVSLYIDHILAADGDPNERPNPGWAGDVGAALAAQYGCTLYPSIRAALLAGENELSVDAVLIIAEVRALTALCFYPRRPLTPPGGGSMATTPGTRRGGTCNHPHPLLAIVLVLALRFAHLTRGYWVGCT